MCLDKLYRIVTVNYLSNRELLFSLRGKAGLSINLLDFWYGCYNKDPLFFYPQVPKAVLFVRFEVLL